MKPRCMLLVSIRFPHNCLIDRETKTVEMHSASGVCIEKLNMMFS